MNFWQILFFFFFFITMFALSFCVFYYFFRMKNGELQNTILVSFSCGMVMQFSSLGFVSSFLLGALVASIVVFLFRFMNVMERVIKKKLIKKKLNIYNLSSGNKLLEEAIRNGVHDEVTHYKTILFSLCSGILFTLLFIEKVHP